MFFIYAQGGKLLNFVANIVLVSLYVTFLVGISATVVDARFCKPLDVSLVRQLAKEH